MLDAAEMVIGSIRQDCSWVLLSMSAAGDGFRYSFLMHVFKAQSRDQRMRCAALPPRRDSARQVAACPWPSNHEQDGEAVSFGNTALSAKRASRAPRLRGRSSTP